MTVPARTYKHLAGAKRAGKKLCLDRGWPGYEIYTLDQIYLVTPDRRVAFEQWLNDHQIPITSGECSRHYVYP